MSIQHELLEQMRDLHLRMHRLFNERVRARGASLAQLKLLTLIDQWGSIRSADIVDAFGHAPRTVTEAVDALEREGLVVRSPDPHDRRAKRIRLTEAGQTIIRDVAPYRDAFAAEFFDVLSDEDLASFLGILQALNDRIVEMGAPRALGNPNAPSDQSGEEQDGDEGDHP